MDTHREQHHYDPAICPGCGQLRPCQLDSESELYALANVDVQDEADWMQSQNADVDDDADYMLRQHQC